MHSEDRYILTHLLSDVQITNDIYYACEEGFIKPNELYEIQDHGDYQENLIQLFAQWYQEKATPEQQMLVDLNGYVHLNDQFDDLQAIIAVEVEKEFLSTQEKAPTEADELALMLEGSKGVFKYLPDGETPIKTESDLAIRANMVYLLSYSDKRNWRELVNDLLFRMRNNHYNGISVQDSLDWLIHYRNAREIECRERIQSAYEAEVEHYENNSTLDYTDDIEEKTVEKSFVEKALGLKKDKAKDYAKKAIKRGLKTLSEFLDKEEVRLFNTESGFIVESGLFNYKFRKSHTSLIEHTMNPISYHIPYDLIVVSKTSNLELANLCIYFDETPIIDQVISTVLFLKTGKEKELLETGNFFNRRDEFYKDPVMEKIQKVQRDINLENYEGMVGEITMQLEEGVSLEGYEEVFLGTTDVIKAVDIEEESRFNRIKKAVFDSMPNFIGSELPEFVYSDFKNLTFDAILDEYNRNNELSPELEQQLRIC